MQIKKKKRRRYAAPIGGLFILLALIGVATVVYGSISLTGSALDNSKEKEMFEDIIRPVVMFDPAPFDKPEDIDMMQLLQYSMWTTLTSEKRASYSYLDNTQLVVPASDLDVACARLFGGDIELQHNSFADYDTRYYYDEDEMVYNVPITAQLYVYSPRVEEITKEGEYYRLYVGYVPPSNAWTIDYSGNASEPQPDKYMYYYMRQTKDSYQLVKVEDLPVEMQPNTAVVENQ